MDIILGKTAGFCYGVERAIKGAKVEIDKQKEVYCLGEIVHNTNVIEDLKKKGIKFIDNIEDAKNDVIIRAHGISKEIYEKAEKMQLKIKDLTCPHVLKIHDIVDEYAKKGYFIFLVGKKDHPEIIGTKSFGGKNITIISDKSEIENSINLLYNTNIKNLLIISQTTYSSKKFDELVEVLNEKISKDINITIKKTICPATEIRQKETEDIAKKVDMMIIIGDKKSSNTNKLYNISCKFCKRVLFIQNKDELNLNELEEVEKVGIMAGASTPKEDIIDIEKILGERNDIKHE